LNNKRARPAPRTTGIMSHLHLVMPIKAAGQTTTVNPIYGVCSRENDMQPEPDREI
jgi:hypothetical protein